MIRVAHLILTCALAVMVGALSFAVLEQRATLETLRRQQHETYMLHLITQDKVMYCLSDVGKQRMLLFHHRHREEE